MFIRQRFFVSQADYIKGNKKPFIIFYLKQTNNLRILGLFNRENKMQVLYQYITKLILKTHKNKSIQFQPALTAHIKFFFHKSSVTFYIHSIFSPTFFSFSLWDKQSFHFRTKLFCFSFTEDTCFTYRKLFLTETYATFLYTLPEKVVPLLFLVVLFSYTYYNFLDISNLSFTEKNLGSRQL